MRTFSLILITGIALLSWSCGPASENREAMYKRAKEFQDSIANNIQMALDEAKIEPKPQVLPVDSAALKATQNPTTNP
ncbi:MAG: hypothetical protein AB7O73_04165 [Bacteroidia bacterium]